MEDKKTKAAFFKFGRYQSSQLDFKEIIDKKEWISFGTANDFPQEAIRLYQTASPLHTALINKKAQMIAGNGFKDVENESISIKLFLKNRFSKDTVDKIVNKCAYDLALFNGFYLNVIWDATGTKISAVEHIPFDRVRAAKCESDDSLGGFYISRDWENVRKAINKPEYYPEFSEKLALEEGEFGKSQIMAVMIYTPGMDYYTLPSYNSSLDSLKSNYELNLFHLKSIQNGFNPGMVIINKGEYTPEEQQELYEDIKSKYTGADNAGDFIMMFAPDADSVPEIIPVQLQATDQRYLDLKQSIVEDIIQGHQATSSVAGREVSGKLGSSQEIIEQHDMFNKTVIIPFQKTIEDAFNRLAEINGLGVELELNSYDYFDSNDNTQITE